MISGPEQMRDWMRRRGFKQADAARYLEMDQGYLSRIVNGEQTPGLNLALKLERLTGIPVETWASIELDEPAAAHAAKGVKRQD